MNTAIKYGVIIGVVGVAIQAVSYVLGIDFMLDTGNTLGIVIALGLYVFFAIKYRSDVGGYINFGDAFQAIMTMALISGVLNLAFQGILYNVIDPSIEVIVKERMIEQTEAMLERFDLPAEQVDEAMANIEDQDFGMTIGNAIKGFLIMYVAIGGILSALLALIIKKKDPESLDY